LKESPATEQEIQFAKSFTDQLREERLVENMAISYVNDNLIFGSI
jgi:hypothetical protein